MDLKTLRHRLHGASAALFYVALLVPGVLHFATEDDARDIALENRSPARRPEWPGDLAAWKQLPKQMETYYADFVRGRTSLLRTNHAVRLRLLGMTPPGSLTIVGKNGWIFFTGNEALEQHRGRRDWTEPMLERACRILRERRSDLMQAGIDYLFVVAPDKMSIYPEELPEWAHPLADRVPLDQLLEAAASNGLSSAILDLRPILRARKTEREIYFPCGTHWNSWGAYFAYRAIAERLSGTRFGPAVSGSTVLGIEELERGSATSAYDSWGEQWHIPELLQHEVPYLETPRAFARSLTRSWWPRVSHDQAQPNHCYVAAKEPGSRLLVFHDSFWDALVPFVTSHFATTAACATYGYDPSLVRAIAPRVVIQLCVERNLWEVFRVDQRIDTRNAWLRDSELAATYANPVWGELAFTRTVQGRMRAEGKTFGTMELEPLLEGVYSARSPLVGSVRLAFFRECGARHLVIRPESMSNAFSFVAPPAVDGGEKRQVRWEGHYAGPRFDIFVQSFGRALWCFQSDGVLSHVIEPRSRSSDVFVDEQDPVVEWHFEDRGEEAARLLLRIGRSDLPPVEFLRR